MTDSDSRRRIGEYAIRVLRAPEDFGAALNLAHALEANWPEKSLLVYARLGAAACESGDVALAVACTRSLRSRGEDSDADALLERITDCHCYGSDRLTGITAMGPPPLPRTEEPVEVTEDPSDLQMQEWIDECLDELQRCTPEGGRFAPTPIVGELEPDEFRALVAVTELLWCDAGQSVIEEGAPATSLYWVARGSLEASRRGHAMGRLRDNAFFGEIALLSGSRRGATVTASERSLLLEIPRDAVEEIAGRQPRLGKLLAGYARERLLANVMRVSPIFVRLDSDRRHALLANFHTAIVESGTTVIEEGTQNDKLFVVVSGTLDVVVEGAVVAQAHSGDAVGEISMLTTKPATASVVSAESTVVLVLERESFESVAVDHPELLAEIYRLVLERRDSDPSESQVFHNADELLV